ncbi:MAG TPA: hypothetical protein PLK94_00085 [Alphaproteobacteria bacterium]|nr:hypothetical protein [Alphaproteobacteria bacterium]
MHESAQETTNQVRATALLIYRGGRIAAEKAGNLFGGKLKAAAVLASGYFALKKGIVAPDSDISLLGIGNHRFFLFHSAIGLEILKRLYGKWNSNVPDEETVQSTLTLKKITGVLLGGYAAGVGIHLALDAMSPKAVIFPLIGSLVDGTLIDDDIWLAANSAWAFSISYNVLRDVIGEDIKNYVSGSSSPSSSTVKEINVNTIRIPGGV